MPWHALLGGRTAERASQAARDIAAALEERVATLDEPSFAKGLAGVAVFFAHAATAWENEELATVAGRCLEKALARAAERTSTLGFYGGLSGVAWAVHHVTERLQGGADASATEELDDALSEALAAKPWVFDFDLIWGLVGMGCYALDHPEPSFGDAALAAVVDRLEELAHEREGGYAWWSPPGLLDEEHAKVHPQGCFDVGLAHGNAGVIGLLAHVHRRGVSRSKTGHLLDGAVRWLLANQRTTPGGSAFGYFAGEESSARSAWCYGDPGVAMALMAAGSSAGCAEWRDTALAIARRDCARAFVETEVVDAELCHGAAGVGHLYNRLFQATRERAFADAARRWFVRTLEMRRGNGIAGFASWWPQAQIWQPDPGFLAGAAGIGLALLAAIGSTAPDWDRPMLVDLEPR